MEGLRRFAERRRHRAEFLDDLRERIIHLAHRLARQWRLVTELEIANLQTAEAVNDATELQQSFAELRAERDLRRKASSHVRR
jgi:hypothetical protein